MDSDVTFEGPPIDDRGTLDRVPLDLRALLEQRNGYVAFRGGLHVRGASVAPTWHSLGYWWFSDDSIHRQFTVVQSTDVPFAQDALGDQFLLRDGEVHRLLAETGELQPLGMGLAGFLDASNRDPIGFLSLEPLERFLANGGTLAPGQLLSIYPPFVFAESQGGVTIKAISVAERIAFLSKLAKAVTEAQDGTRVRFEIDEEMLRKLTNG